MSKKVSELEVLSSPASNDLLLIVDASDTSSDHPNGKSKQISFANLTNGLSGGSGGGAESDTLQSVVARGNTTNLPLIDTSPTGIYVVSGDILLGINTLPPANPGKVLVFGDKGSNPTLNTGQGGIWLNGANFNLKAGNGPTCTIDQSLATPDTPRFGKLGIGANNGGTVGIQVSPTGLTGTSQFGISCDPITNSASISNSFGIYTRTNLINSSYTTTRGGGIYVDNIPAFSGPSLTQQIGIYINDQSRGVNNFGVYSNVGAGSGKWGWYGNGLANNYTAGSWVFGNTSLPTVGSGEAAICSAGSTLSARHSDSSNNNYTTRLTRGDNVVASGSGNITFNLNDGLVRLFTLTGNMTLALSNVVVGDIIKIRLQQDNVGSRTVTWFSTIKWAGGSPPTLTTTANKADWITIICTSSGNYDGAVAMANV